VNKGLCALLFVGLLGAPFAAAAQEAELASTVWREFGDPYDARGRWHALTDGEGLPPLLRASLIPGREADGVTWILPRVRVVTNSGLPHSLNEGALWAGRGSNLAVAGGAAMRWRAVELRIAPEVSYSSNAGFPLLRSSGSERSAYATPWRRGTQSADLPQRMGHAPLLTIDPGQTRLTVDAGPARFGFTTESRWWGPGHRNAIVMSSNAPGIPHLFGEGEVDTRLGRVRAVWMSGVLVESPFFDRDPANDLRSLSAAAVELSPRGSDALSVGAARSVYAPMESALGVARAAPDVLARWQCGVEEGDRPCEQLYSLFGRWSPAGTGVAVHLEWARTEPPESVRELLVAPNHSQGYTVGLAWAGEMLGGTAGVETELTYLEESATFRSRTPRPFYTSEVVPQGYTHRGRTVGAAIGPGASSQWGRVRYGRGAWGAGLHAGRIRWDNVAYYQVRPHFRGLEHDVSLFGGADVKGQTGAGWVSAGLQYERRMNLHFRSLQTAAAEREPLDARNLTLRLRFAPEMPRR
jgi:hypothetical protein